MALLNERLKERRIAAGMTLLQVAELLGIKEATMQRYESGEIKNIKHETIAKLAEIYKCSPEYLMGWSDSLYRNKTKDGEATLIETVAAHRDVEDWTPEELQKIEEYKQLLLAARKNKK
jgi:transcriptional regulator with XRE-family HTH domain